MALSGSFAFEDKATLTGVRNGPFTVDAVAQIDLGAGPYPFDDITSANIFAARSDA